MAKTQNKKKPEVARTPISEIGRAMGVHKFYVNAIAFSEKKNPEEFLVTPDEFKKLYKKYYKGR